MFVIQAADVDTSSTWPDDRDFQNDEATDLTDDEWVWIAPMLPVVEIFRPEPRKGDETVILSALHRLPPRNGAHPRLGRDREGFDPA